VCWNHWAANVSRIPMQRLPRGRSGCSGLQVVSLHADTTLPSIWISEPGYLQWMVEVPALAFLAKLDPPQFCVAQLPSFFPCAQLSSESGLACLCKGEPFLFACAENGRKCTASHYGSPHSDGRINMECMYLLHAALSPWMSGCRLHPWAQSP